MFNKSPKPQSRIDSLIGATTRAGLLSAPLRDRFHMREHLDFYSVEELTEIVIRNAKKMAVKIDVKAAGEVATRSRGTPSSFK